MFTGTSPGAGKSAAVRAIAKRLRADGRSVLVVDEDDVWGDRELGERPVDRGSALPEFEALVAARPTEAVGGLIDTFVAVRQRLGASPHVLLQDWAWPDLAASLLRGDVATSVMTVSRQLAELAADLHPLLFFLQADARRAITRAMADRGDTWLRRHAAAIGLHEGSEVTLVDAVSRHYAGRERERLEYLAATDWAPVVLNADVPIEDVVDAALYIAGSGPASEGVSSARP